MTICSHFLSSFLSFLLSGMKWTLNVLCLYVEIILFEIKAFLKQLNPSSKLTAAVFTEQLNSEHQSDKWIILQIKREISKCHNDVRLENLNNVDKDIPCTCCNKSSLLPPSSLLFPYNETHSYRVFSLVNPLRWLSVFHFLWDKIMFCYHLAFIVQYNNVIVIILSYHL